MRCGEYDPQRISAIVKTGMEALGIRPSDKVILKPNVVIAHPKIFPHAFTRKEFLDGVLAAARSLAATNTEIAVGERSGITLPTRFCFRHAGYPEVLKKHRTKAYYFDESVQVPVPLNHPDALRKQIYIPEPVADADCLINLPKFKAHPWCRLTLSLKNFIGLQDDRHRLVDHNLFLEHKIADLQEVIQPSFIAVDAIIAGQRMMLTPTPFPMGAIIMGSNSCAVDTVGCHMVNVDPHDVIHLRYTSLRGYGPAELNEIDVDGDFPLKEVQEKTRGFQFCMDPIDTYFGADSNLSCTVGTFPEAHSPDYCWGGCPGALQEAMHIYKATYPNIQQTMGKVRYVVGKVDGPLNLSPDERVIFAGDCTRWAGKIEDEDVTIESSYQSPDEIDETQTPSNDMLFKTVKTAWAAYSRWNSRYIHARGCPVSVGDHVHFLAVFGKIKNANFDVRVIFSLNMMYLLMRIHRWFNHLLRSKRRK